MHFDLKTIRRNFSRLNFVVVGDCMLDRYTTGDVSRVSPEAPVVILHYESSSSLPGGAANVALNIARLGMPCKLVSIVGEDQEAEELRSFIASEDHLEAGLVTVKGRRTTVKHRIIANALSTHLIRLDAEDTRAIGADIEDAIFDEIFNSGSPVDGLLISDYAKGVITFSLAERLIAEAKARQIHVIVDPKGRDYARYRGASVVTPNLSEAFLAVGEPLLRDNPAVERVARMLCQTYEFETVVVTRGEDGLLALAGQDVITLPSTAPKVVDVSGAGDTFVAALSAFLSIRWPLDQALRLATAAAGVSVGHRGATAVTLDEVALNLSRDAERAEPARAEDKIVQDWATLRSRIDDWRRQGLRVGFTNGCFDLLHAGHVTLLMKARAMCDRLVVALNTDESVRALKGPSRPVQNQEDRLLIMAALGYTDAVTAFSEQTPENLIHALAPDVLFKGGDYRADDVVGAGFVKSYGGTVQIIDLVANRSSTSLIERNANRS